MGTYATTTSISNLLPGFLRGNTTTSDTAGVNFFSAHIDRAESEVNAVVAKRYSMPFATSTSIPPLLRTISENIATYNTALAAFGQDGKQKWQYLEDYYGKATKYLEQLDTGDMQLTNTDGSLVATRATNRIRSNTEDYTPIFGMDDPTKWKRDDTEITDQSDARI